MEYRRLGRTDIPVSGVIFGCGNVGGILIDSDAETMTRAVERALDGGINWFDTAAQYGKGRSETNLGAILAGASAMPHVSTKVRIDPADTHDMPAQVERSLRGSLQRLRRDSVDLVQLHNGVEAAPGGRSLSLAQVLGPGGALEGLERVRDLGLARHIGMTALGDADLCREVIESARVETAQVYFNLLNPSAGAESASPRGVQSFAGLIGACERHGVGVIVIRALAAGVLATDVRHGRESIITSGTVLAEEERRARVLREALGDAWGSMARVALRYVLGHPGVACVDVGVGAHAHLEEALAAAADGPLPRAALDIIRTVHDSGFEPGSSQGS